MNSQQLIMERIASAIANDGADVVLINDRRYANTGTLRTVDAATLEHVASVTYNFQDGYCNFGPMIRPVASLHYGQSAEGKANWVCGSIPELVNSVVNHLLTTRREA